MSKNIRTLLLLPLFAALPAAAAETSFGLQGHVGIPTGAFGDAGHLDRRVGLGVGFQLPIDFGAGNVLRPKLDYLAFSRDSAGVRYKVDSLLFLADYLYYFNETRQGPYVLGGLGLHSTRRDATRPFAGVNQSTDTSGTGFAYDLGLGYAFNRNVALELKYTGLNLGTLQYKVAGSDPSFLASTVVASVSLTF